MDSDLINRIRELEQKEQQFDMLVSRIVGLQGFVDDFTSGDPSRLPANKEAQIQPLSDLINFVYPVSAEFKAQLEKDGFHEGAPKKYTSSTFDEELITSIRMYKDGRVSINTTENAYHFEMCPKHFDYSKSIDNLLILLSESLEQIEIRK